MTKENLQKTIVMSNDKAVLTIQGEGHHSGRPAVFVRTSTCNLRCEWVNKNGSTTLCDTAYTSHQPETNVKTVESILAEIERVKGKCRRVVLTGGEPLLQRNVSFLMYELYRTGHQLTVETNGTCLPVGVPAFYSISPKLRGSCPKESPNYDRHEKHRLNIPVLQKLCCHKHQFKFVVNDEQDIEQIHYIIANMKDYFGHYDSDRVWLMPQGIESKQLDEKLEFIAKTCIENNWNYSDRLHIRIWGKKRGV